MTYNILDIECGRNVRSLAWQGDALVDWVCGGRTYHLDGTVDDPHVNFSYRFDAVAASPDGRYAVIVERLGTRGLLLRDGQILRELDRSFYCASAYEYPVCLWHAGGRTLLAHCPREYCLLRIEDADSGAILAEAQGDEAADFFHSRLAVSPGGRYLLSAGWVWHPWSAVVVFDIARALEDPAHLASHGCCEDPLNPEGEEDVSATWLSADRLVSTTEEGAKVCVYDVTRRERVCAVELDRPAGTVMRVGTEHVVAFHGHPRLIRLVDGAVLHEWTELNCGEQLSSIMHHHDAPPPMAFDPDGGRFAVFDGERIRVVVLGP